MRKAKSPKVVKTRPLKRKAAATPVAKAVLSEVDREERNRKHVVEVVQRLKQSKDAKDRKLAKRIQKALIQIPDLRIFIDRWNNFYICSLTGNSTANMMQMKHSCSCCGDSPLLVWIYKEINLGDCVEKLYTWPPKADIGEKNDYWPGGEEIYPNWRERLNEQVPGLSEDMKEKIAEHIYDLSQQEPLCEMD